MDISAKEQEFLKVKNSGKSLALSYKYLFTLFVKDFCFFNFLIWPLYALHIRVRCWKVIASSYLIFGSRPDECMFFFFTLQVLLARILARA